MTKDRTTVLFLGDVIALALSLFLMLAIRFDFNAQRAVVVLQVKIFLFLFVLWLIIFFIFDLYNLRLVNPNPRNIGLLAIAIVTASLASVLVFYISAYNGITPKTNLAIVAVIAFVLLVFWRRLYYTLFSSRFVQRIAVIGEGPAVDHLLTDMKKNPHIGKVIHVQKKYTDATDIPSIDILIAHNVDLEGLFYVSREKDCEIFSLFEAYEALLGKIPITLMDDEKAVEVLTRKNMLTYRFIGRSFEIIIALIVIALSSPFLILAICAILIEDGRPIFIRQKRVGKNGKQFLLYKLRTMVKNAEINGAQWADKKDPRVTRVGRILRKTHLDEVPQMINILKGDIALIGPRPERPEFVHELEKAIPYYFLRHTVKPGFTGWAQIKFRYARNIDDAKEKFEYDLFYLLKRNPLLNLGITLKTVQIIFTHQ
ncbi:MAG TPA: sugar transferase [Candidatus Paceibacterota bacterium]|nr:sugar transferase [Candidatus Paceibacterota bacterium]